MRLPRLRRPRLHDRDPARRRVAVARLAASDKAVGELAELVHHDPDAGVRAAAVKRLEDLALLRRCLEGDADALVRESARARYRQLLAGGRQPLAVRRAELERCPDGQILAHVARSGREEALRAAALARVAEPAVLEEAARHDPSARLRRQAVELLDDRAALTRLARPGPDGDRRLARLARERLEGLTAEDREQAASEQEAERLTAALWALLEESGGSRAARRDRLVNRWRRLAPPPSPQRQRGFEQALARVDAEL